MTTSTPAGWYDDPEDSGGQRYWDGQSWTSNRARKSVPAPAPAAVPPPPGQQASWQPPGYPAGGPPPRKRNPLPIIIGVLIAVLVVGGLVVGSVVAWFSLKAKPQSPEDQIRATVQHITDDFNASKFGHDAAWQCKANTDSDNASADKDLTTARTKGGTATASVTNIQVSGDHATADVTLTLQKLPRKPIHENLQFVKEDGSWKECTPPDSNSSDSSNSSDDGDQSSGG